MTIPPAARLSSMTPELRRRLEALAIVARMDPARIPHALDVAERHPDFPTSPARVLVRVMLRDKLAHTPSPR